MIASAAVTVLASAIGVGTVALVRWSGAPVVPLRAPSSHEPAEGTAAPPAENGDAGGNQPIVFASSRGGRYHLYLINPDGTGDTALTTGTGEERTPEWSPRRDRIAFTRFVEPGGSIADIYIIRADGTGLTRLTHGPEVEEDPSWSPDGERIVFTASDRGTGRTRIRIENVDGTEAGQLPAPPAGCLDREPTWSPDGSSIAFARKCGDDPSKLYAIGADGSGLRLLAHFGRTPDWSPDGSKIAYTGWGRDGPAIFIANADGSGGVQLTADGSGDPVWSPDGTRIAFTVNGLASLQIYVINVDGSGERRLTTGGADEVMPSW
jgi:Tol biopolymer transport system component